MKGLTVPVRSSPDATNDGNIVALVSWPQVVEPLGRPNANTAWLELGSGRWISTVNTGDGVTPILRRLELSRHAIASFTFELYNDDAHVPTSGPIQLGPFVNGTEIVHGRACGPN